MPKHIYESKALQDAAKRFRMLCEYTFNITEDDGEENVDLEQEPEALDSDSQINAEDNVENNQNVDLDNDQSLDSGGVNGFNPTTNGVENDMQVSNIDSIENDDEVIDVDDLTQSQEKTEDKVDDIQISIDKGFDKLLNVVAKLDKMIDDSTHNMEQIKQEIEKRNPTPIEKLNMRAANDSYPFNVSPNDYWREKELNSNYRIGGEDEEDAKQYIITQGDIDNITDFRKISKELEDSEINQNLLNIFGMK